MIGFSYIYKSSEEIFSNFISFGALSLGSGITLLISIGMTLICIFMIFPSILIFFEHRKIKLEKKYKKKLLEQILVQKEIEDEIDKQVHIEEKQKR